ncbi:hypothetical protein TSOC_011390 [Tetrabaena socialis]|uniref:N-acetyltransferase domain-containing protein n=1 Tax=Tetrabaena socialis TaxID=47790 RepID=A0A2J7ZQU8_9CHLO|nr:hypothetical protein TSOC_011390 [Tetrabaena socialis]|eukprot:PNH02630.1 hypothetical protein TSOC_011390 [Tetrabaena socialis]
MPRMIHRLASDPGVTILAAVARAEDDGRGPGADQAQERQQEAGAAAGAPVAAGELLPGEQAQHSGRVDGIICGERRASTVFLYGLRVREDSRGRGLGRLLMRFIVSCTVSYNTAAQRIIGRQLHGPIHQVEVWPAGPSLEGYEEAAGWVRGRGTRAGAPHMLDWIPGARAALEADAAAQALLPRWRRASTADELSRAVAHLLYGTQASSHGVSATPHAAGLTPLLWLPMPYEVWPLESGFVQRELAAGNVWVLTAPRTYGRGSSTTGLLSSASGEEEETVGVMLLSHFETTSRVSAGILARDSSATHAAVAHAGSLHPHFLAYTLRIPTGAAPPLQPAAAAVPSGPGGGRSQDDAVQGPGGRAEEAEPAPALYGTTGGCRDFWVYGRALPPPAARL